jgi:tetratricopeptide (TPR) repeat protein
VRILLLATAIFVSAPALAQMAVTTFGAGDAQTCYEYARDDYARDTTPCDKALNLKMSASDTKKTLVNRGIIHNRTRALDLALADFNAALAIDGDLAEAYLNRGNTHFLSNRIDAALADYEKALALDVNKPWAAWYNIGLAHEAKGDKPKAQEAYAKALELNPDFSPAKAKLEGGQ